MHSRWAKTFANYNRSMNERLYAHCAQLSDAERKRDLGAFFKSIHGTLNHLLLTDRVWLGRLIKEPFAIRSLDQELYADFEELRIERAKTDGAIATWADTLRPEEWNREFEYFSLAGHRRAFPLWFVAAHLFNHQTHHRGQLTTLLSQCGVDPGVTDFLTFPIVST